MLNFFRFRSKFKSEDALLMLNWRKFIAGLNIDVKLNEINHHIKDWIQIMTNSDDFLMVRLIFIQ